MSVRILTFVRSPLKLFSEKAGRRIAAPMQADTDAEAPIMGEMSFPWKI